MVKSAKLVSIADGIYISMYEIAGVNKYVMVAIKG